ncbi:phospholipase D-like domain-containing protein [Oryzobacter telluris]|uniref:phospholipase D-like domain-containing protein n=1 Tax=Oryzobacter telluris TaxID=3149179 RepID=UPI00370D6A1F
MSDAPPCPPKGLRTRRIVPAVLATAAAIAAIVLTPAPALAVPNGSETVTVGTRPVDVTFNVPGNDAQWDQAARLIRDATPGSTARIAIYNLTSTLVRDAIREAVGDGVNVYVVANGEHHEGATNMLDGLKSLLGARFKWCDADRTSSNANDACISNDPSGLMHAKYMTFSQTRGRAGALRNNVVWVSSANFSGSGKDLYNNSVTVYDDSALYSGFLSDVWNPMWNNTSYADNDYYNVSLNRGYFSSGASSSTVYVSPEQTTDLWENRLDYVDPDSSCRIRVMHNVFNDTRIAVARKLRELARGGCVIRVIAATIQSDIRATLNHPNISIRRAAVHDKTILINSKYAGSSTNRFNVFTGSHNLTQSALQRNDEIIIRLADSKPLHDLFVEHFQRAWADGTDVPGGSS